MQITAAQIKQILPQVEETMPLVAPLNAAMARFQISTSQRAAAFIAQIGCESAQLDRLVENLNYSAQALVRVWPRHFTLELAEEAAHDPEKIANIAYAFRMGNGPVESGDGWKYRGRGFIQVTGRDNYQSIGDALSLDLLAHPELLQQPEYAALSAARFWSVSGLNTLADKGEFEAITLKINGGLDGETDRLAFYQRALTVLG